MADADIIVIGAGLAGLVAAAEAADAGRSVIVLDQEGAASIGGQAWWSLGGLFLVNSPEQRHLGVKDSAELAMADWLGSAGFDRPEDHWPRQWAQAYVEFAAGEKRAWLKELDVSLFPIPGWAERGGYQVVGGHGNSVPRFHLVWGSGTRGAHPVRQAGDRTRQDRPDPAAVPAPGDRADPGRGRRHRGGRRDPRTDRGRQGRAVVPDGHRRLQPRLLGGDRHLRRGRRQPRAGAAELAGRAGRGACGHALRGARFDGRADARHHRAGRRPGDQRRPDVALPGGRGQPLAGVDVARHPDPVRPEPAVAGRVRQAAADPALSRVRRAGGAATHPVDRPHPLLVPAGQQDDRPGIRPVRVRNRTPTSRRSR